MLREYLLREGFGVAYESCQNLYNRTTNGFLTFEAKYFRGFFEPQIECENTP